MTTVTDKRWLAVDPGEMTGWSVWKGETLLGGGQTPLWQFAHDLWDAVESDKGPLAPRKAGESMLRAGFTAADNETPSGNAFDLIVCEKFALYPWKAKELAWDEFRTVQLIGAITFMATLRDIELHKQGANIKARATDGGAGELFTRPLRENRHENDSIMHGFYFIQVECR